MQKDRVMTADPIRLLLLDENDGAAALEEAKLAAHAPGEFVTTRVNRLAQALSRIEKEHFDVVLSDLGLLERDGTHSLHALAGKMPSLPLVVLTDPDDDVAGHAAIRCGAQDFLVKGNSSGELVARTLRHAIERRHFDVALRDADETLERKIAERTAALENSLRSVQESEQRFQAVCQSANDAIVTVDCNGKMVGWNRGAADIFGYTADETEGRPLSLLIPARLRKNHQDRMKRMLFGAGANDAHKILELTGLRKDVSEFPLEMTGAKWEVAGNYFFTAVIRDITQRKAADAKIQRLSNLYAALSQCNQAIVRCRDENELFSQICSDAVTLGGMKMAWIGMLDEARGQILPVAACGDGMGYLDNIAIFVDSEHPLGHGPAAVAFRENRSVWCQDFQHDPATTPWHARGAEYGWGASASLPLHRNEVTVGTFTVYAGEADVFDLQARNLLEEMAIDISFGLGNFAREAARQGSERLLKESENRFRDLYEKAPLPYQALDIDGRILAANEAWLQAIGFASDEVIGRSFGDFMSAASNNLLAAEFPSFMSAGKASFPEFEFVCKDGRRRMFRVNCQIALDGDGKFVRTHCILTDVTDALQTETQLKLAADVFDQSTEGIMIADSDRNIVLVNQAFSAITGFRREEVLGKNPRVLSSGRQDHEFYRAMWKSIETTGRWQGELWNRSKDGNVYPEWLSISRILDASGNVTHYIGTFSDITQRKAAEEHIQWLAHFDTLTGLPNRVLAADRTRQSLSMVQRSNEPLALMFLDLDHFKNVNDALGHQVGDALLAQLSGRLTGELREQDTVSRLGGDEFILVLPGTDATGAAHLAQKLTEIVARPYHIDQHELRMTTSIGIAMYPNDAADFESLSKCADVAMHRAKADGRNACRFFTREMQERSARRVLLENELHRVLERCELSLHYQPQISMRDGRIVGAEALLRWQHPELGMISPTEFIPIVESSGLILPIGEWVLRSAVRQWKRWLDFGFAPMTLAVNLSAVQFRHPHLTQLVTRILDEEMLAPRYLELELTEGIAMDDPLAAIAVMDGLHQHGVRMSIDDFGTGYSSLNYLKRFKVYKLKIDQSFVRDIPTDPDDKAIVGAIISLASNLGMQTIAEGVETAEQVAFLREKGCDEVQGYYFSRPLSAEQFEAFVRINNEDIASAATITDDLGQVVDTGQEDMANFSWSDEFSVGDADIDADHRLLIGLLNDLYHAMREGRGNEVLGELLGDLVRQTKEHFKREEDYMQRLGYPDFVAHKQEHDRLMLSVRDFQKRFDAGEANLSQQMLTFLFDWLLNHIMHIDKKLMPGKTASKPS